MKNREDIKSFILKIETDFPVNNWKINDIYIWPFLRNQLFFYLIYAIENEKLKFKIDEKKIKSKNNIFKFCISIFNWLLFKKNLKRKINLFFSQEHIRVNYDNNSFDRFFDSIIEEKNIKNVSYLFNYHSEKKRENLIPKNSNNYFHLLIYNNGFKNLYKLREKIFYKNNLIESQDFKNYYLLTNYLLENEITSNFAIKFSEELILDYFKNIFINKLFFIHILDKIKPQTIYLICYYTPIMHALLIASKERNIKVIEVQHGPMSNTHLSYSNWTNVPKLGYQLLPDEFWCWDNDSLINMKKWTTKTNTHNAFLGGNPWVDFLKNKNKKYFLPNNFVLYTLQPLVYDVLFPEELIKLIKKGDLFWYVRLHPRQYNQKKEILTFLSEKEIIQYINIEDAFNLPLPVLLYKCKIHLTHFSGSAIEASLLNKFSIILDKLGEETFKNLISEQKAVFLPIDNNFSKEFFKLINK